MQLLFTLIAILLIFSFVLKAALIPRKSWVALVAFAALALWFAFPWLTSLPRSTVTGVFSDSKILDEIDKLFGSGSPQLYSDTSHLRNSDRSL